MSCKKAEAHSRDFTLNGSTLELDWDEMSTGDCHQKNGKMVFEDSGKGVFTCTTWTDSTHSGDTWQSTFAAYDVNNVYLFTFGGDGCDSPRMSDGGPTYDWQYQFQFPADKFGAISKVTQTSTC